jgi:two-component system, sensor histidine kinase and response regulator
VVWAILDQLVFRTGVDLTGWIPFLLAVVFALVFVDQFWRLQKEEVETNRQLALSRDHLEEQVQARSAELRAANTELSTTNQRLIDTGAQAQAALEEVRRLNAGLEGRVQERTSELRLAKEAAEAASRAKTAFLAIMGHELRTPLNGIFLAAEMLRDNDASQAANRDLPDTILASGRRLLRMVEGVLEYATADAPPSAAPLNVEAALQDVATRFETRAAQKGVALTFHISPAVPSVDFDQLQFDQVLRRLVENALKYTPEGGRVTVAAEPVPCWAFPQGEGPALRVTVADTGAGLKDEDCERVFEPFVQLEASYLHHSEGVGLGLTLARRHVDLYGGHIWAESGGPGKGSTFTVLIPVQRGPANLTAASSDSPATSAKL